MAALLNKISKFSRQEIDQLWKEAHRVVKHDGLHILIAPQSGEFGRALIVIPKRVGNAPTRNKLRRQLKHISYEKQLYEGDRDWIILVRPEATQHAFSTLKNLLLNAQHSTV